MDTQSIIDCVGGGNGGVPRVARAYQRALASSVQATFKVRYYGKVVHLEYPYKQVPIKVHYVNLIVLQRMAGEHVW